MASLGRIEQPVKDSRPELTVVAGPPCAGKTTYVRQHRAPTDLVLDLDDLAASLTGGDGYNQQKLAQPFAVTARNAVLDHYLTRPGNASHLWLIRSAPRLQERHEYDWAGAAIVLLMPEMSTLLSRARAERPPVWAGYIHDWFRTYEPEQA